MKWSQTLKISKPKLEISNSYPWKLSPVISLKKYPSPYLPVPHTPSSKITVWFTPRSTAWPFAIGSKPRKLGIGIIVGAGVGCMNGPCWFVCRCVCGGRGYCNTGTHLPVKHRSPVLTHKNETSFKKNAGPHAKASRYKSALFRRVLMCCRASQTPAAARAFWWNCRYFDQIHFEVGIFETCGLQITTIFVGL